MHSPCFTPHAIASARPPCAPTDHPSSASNLCDLARPPLSGAVGQLGPAAALVGLVGGLGRQRVPCVGRGVVGGRGLGRGGHDLGGACVVRGLGARLVRELKKIKMAWPDLHYSTSKGVLLLSPSPPRISPSQLSLVE